MQHTDIDKLHVNMIMLHVDILYLALGAGVCHHTFMFHTFKK